jgi:hypothetical protein
MDASCAWDRIGNRAQVFWTRDLREGSAWCQRGVVAQLAVHAASWPCGQEPRAGVTQAPARNTRECEGNARLCEPMQRGKRTVPVSACWHEQRRRSRSRSHRQVDDRQARIAVVMPPANRDFRLKSVSRADRNRFRKTAALPCLLRRQPAQGAVWADFVEPVLEVIHPAPDAPLRKARQDKPPPSTKGSGYPLDLTVQTGRPDSSLHGDDAHVLHRGPELPTELRAMIGDDEPGLQPVSGRYNAQVVKRRARAARGIPGR